jgi:hypothetical protein
MIRKVLAGLIALLAGVSVYAHPVHVSVCNFEIEQGQMTIAVKLFLDDFQLALQHNYGKIIPFEEMGNEENKKLLDAYINAALQIVLNKKDSIRLFYDKTEMNEEAIWIFYEINPVDIHNLSIKNMLLLDIYSDQTNLVIVHKEGRQRGYRFTSREFEQIIELK